MKSRIITTPAAATLLLMLTFSVGGCEFNSPELPSFETKIVLPLGTERLEIIDAVDDEDYLVVNGDGSLGFLFEGDADSLNFNIDLSTTIASQNISQGLGNFDLPNPAPLAYDFQLGDIWAPAAGVVGLNTIVPAFPLSIISPGQALPNLQSATLTSGLLSISLSNGLPVTIGANSGPDQINVRLEDATNGELIVAIPFSTIAPGSAQNQLANLAGKVLPQNIAVRLTGGSPGSMGQFVTINGTDALGIDASFTDLVVSSATAVVGDQSFSTSFDADLPAGYEVTRAVINSGFLSLSLRNNLPVACTAQIIWPQVRNIDGVPLSRTVPLASGQSVIEDLDFSGYIVQADGMPLTTLTAQVNITSPGSGGQPVTMTAADGLEVTLSAGSIEFSSITGIVPEIIVPLDPIVQTIDLPAEMEGLELTAASLTLTVTNAAGIPADLDLRLTGTAADGSTQMLTVTDQILPAVGRAAAVTTIVLDESNSAILNFLNNLPETITLEGDVLAGGGVTGTVHDDDYAVISWTIAAPLEVIIDGAMIDSDPSLLDLDAGLRDRISTHARGAVLRSEVFSHLPMAIELTLVMAADEASLDSAPLLSIGPLTIAAGQLDPVTHAVSQGVTSTPVVNLSAAEAQLFGLPGLVIRIQALLPSTNGQPVRIMSSDYLEFRGVVELEVLVDDEF